MYEQFAQFYDRFGWSAYSKELWLKFKNYLDSIDFKPETMLDIACGTGILTISASKDGLMAEGLDLSEAMIKKASNNASDAGLNIKFYNADMSSFKLDKKYDLITCTFDAINHMTDFRKWVSMFKCVKQHLNDDCGIFMFDMHTLKELKENWNNIHIQKYPSGDYRLSKSISSGDIACVTFTVFVKKDNLLFEGYEETVREASFVIEDVRTELRCVGFSEIDVMNRNFEVANDPEELLRAFIVCR